MAHDTLNNKLGRILNPYGVDMRLVEPEEKHVADILIQTGYDVIFLPKFSVIKYPDILYKNKRWEIKSPKGSSTRHTIDNNLREALEQSENIIVNLERINMIEIKCINTLRNQFKRVNAIKNLIIITKKGKIIEL